MKNEPIDTMPKWRKWLYIISPCILAAVFSLFIIVSSYLSLNRSGGWSYLPMMIFIPVLFIMLVIDVFVKLITKKNVLYVWLIEIVLIIAVIIFYKIYINK